MIKRIRKKRMSTKLLCTFICLLSVVMTGCNSREDVSLSSVEEITDYVESVIDEPIRYISTTEYKEHSFASYIYLLEERNIEFEVEAHIRADFFEALQLSNYKEEIEIGYEKAIVNDDYYVEERLKTAEKYDVPDIYHNEERDSYFYLKFNEFSELENITKYIKDVDELYSFKEKKTEKAEHIHIYLFSNKVGAIYTSATGGHFQFSKTKQDEIKEEELLEQLQIMYVYFGDFRDCKDNSIPDELWNELLNKY